MPVMWSRDVTNFIESLSTSINHRYLHFTAFLHMLNKKNLGQLHTKVMNVFHTVDRMFTVGLHGLMF